MNFKKFLTGLALVGLVGVAGLTSAYYPGNDGFDVPTYGNATLVNSLTVGGNAMITDDTVSGDYLNVNTTDDCTVGRININACVTNSVNPVVNVGGSLVGAAANNYHVFSDSRDVNLAAGTAANLVVKASAGNLYGFNVSADSTLSGAAWWLIAYDATSAPADGAITPALCYAVPSGTTSINGTLNVPVAFATGITLGVSTTGCFTKTASTHAFISADYK